LALSQERACFLSTPLGKWVRVIANLLHPFLKPERRFLCQNLLKNAFNAPNVNQILMPGATALNIDIYSVTDAVIVDANINLRQQDQSVSINTRSSSAQDAAQE
jgi:hypothetical protein